MSEKRFIVKKEYIKRCELTPPELQRFLLIIQTYMTQ